MIDMQIKITGHAKTCEIPFSDPGHGAPLSMPILQNFLELRFNQRNESSI